MEWEFASRQGLRWCSSRLPPVLERGWWICDAVVGVEFSGSDAAGGGKICSLWSFWSAGARPWCEHVPFPARILLRFFDSYPNLSLIKYSLYSFLLLLLTFFKTGIYINQ
jgi:hypothetical protein